MRIDRVLGPIVPVDRDVILGEVAGEHAIAPAPEPERHLDADLRLFHQCRDFGFIIGGVARAAVGDADAPEPERTVLVNEKPVDVTRGIPLTLGQLGYVMAKNSGFRDALRPRLINGDCCSPAGDGFSRASPVTVTQLPILTW